MDADGIEEQSALELNDGFLPFLRKFRFFPRSPVLGTGRVLGRIFPGPDVEGLQHLGILDVFHLVVMLGGEETFILPFFGRLDSVAVLLEIFLEGVHGGFQHRCCHQFTGQVGRPQAGDFQGDMAFGAAAEEKAQQQAPKEHDFSHKALPAVLFFSKSFKVSSWSTFFRTFPSPVRGSSRARKYFFGIL